MAMADARARVARHKAAEGDRVQAAYCGRRQFLQIEKTPRRKVNGVEAARGGAGGSIRERDIHTYI